MNFPELISSESLTDQGNMRNLREQLIGDQAHQFTLGISGHEAQIVDALIRKIGWQVKTLETIDDVLELGDLIQGFIDVLQSYEQTLDQMSYHVIESHQSHSIRHIRGFCLGFLENLWGRSERLSEKTKLYPELERRWEREIEKIGGDIGALLLSFEELIDDPGYNWKEARVIFDTTIRRIGEIEDFVDRFIELRTAKQVEEILSHASRSGEDAGSEKKEQEGKSETREDIEKQKARRARIQKYLFKKEDTKNLLSDPSSLIKRKKNIEQFYATLGISPEELEELISEGTEGRDLLWLNEHLALLRKNPDDEILRHEIESTLLTMRCGQTRIDLEGIAGKDDTYIEIFTEEGRITLAPPFREYQGILYAETPWKGKAIKCKFPREALIYNTPLSIEFLDKASFKWKKRIVTPLIAWRKSLEKVSHESSELIVPDEKPLTITTDTYPETIPVPLEEIREREALEPPLTDSSPKAAIPREKRGFIPSLSRGISWIKKQFSRI